MLKNLFGLIIFFIMIGCGGSKGSIEDVAPKNLYFIDSPVNGLEYSCGDYHGLTGFNTKSGLPTEDGLLICTNKKIIFFIGSLIFPSIPEKSYIDKKNIYPQTLFGQAQNVYKTPKVLNFARFIQSIDDDGHIETSINITQTMRDKISALGITSIDWTSEKVVLDILKELNVTIRNKEEVERHLLVHSKTPYIEKENLIFSVNENTEINNEINKLTILYPQDINEIKISDEDKKEREYFSISANGSISLKKKLNYKKQHTHSFTIQGEGKQTSNYVTITVHVMPSEQEEAEPIDAPTIVYADNNSILYTNTSNYSVNIQGRKKTNIYWEEEKIAVMPNEGIKHLPRNISIKNKEQRYSIKLGYDNSIESPNTTLKVWYDEQKPVFVTATEILVSENIKLAKAIDVHDTLKSHGLLFELDGGVDKNLFSISSTTGLLEFRENVDYDNREDSNQDNVYEVSVKVTDKAGNPKSKIFKVKVENIESTPLIEDSQFTIDDDKKVNDYIGTIKIDSEDSIISSIKLFDDDKSYFKVTTEGKVYLSKKVLYQSKNNFLFKVQVTNSRGKASNTATVSIRVKSKNTSLEEPIIAPIITYGNGLSKVYTKTDKYSFLIYGRANTNIYLDNKKIAVMKKTGNFLLTQSIYGADKEEKHELYLKYNNGIYGKTTKFTVIKDTTEPTFLTSANISINENVLQIDTIQMDDNFKKEGLTFSLNGGVDKNLFTVLATKGVLTFKAKVDHEHPKDSNKDNVYEVNIKVTDKAGNPASKLFKIKVANQESVPTVEPLTKTISDDKEIGYKIDTLTINHKNSSIKSITLEGDDAKHFTVSNDGVIRLKQKVHYQTQKEYVFNAYATNDKDERSNKATITIKIVSFESQVMTEIEAPIIVYVNNDSKIYTNTNRYSFEIQGRKNTNIYLDNKENKLGVISESGVFIVTQAIEGEDKTEAHNIYLAYDNGVISKVANFTVIKDTIAPEITTSTLLKKEENIKLITNIEVTDTNKEAGLTFLLEDEKDAQSFTLLYNGELSFNQLPNFEEPLDRNTDNNYELTIKVTDKAGNSSNINLTVRVLDVLDSKPSIEAFEEDITTSSLVGTTIGQLSIHEGNSALLDLNITGTGAENFYINRNGTLILINQLSTTQTYTLTINARNEFGIISSNITVNIVNFEKIAQVQLVNRVSRATVKLFEINSDNTQELIYTTTTRETGNFDIQPSLLENHKLYLYEVTDGYENNEENKGVLRLITKGSWIKNSTRKIIISPLSEMIYDYVAKYVKYDYSQIENKLNEYTDLLLSKDLNDDYQINANDFINFDIIHDKDALSYTLKYNNTYESLSKKIKDNNSEYINELFHAYTVNSFVANDIIINDSIVFSIDIEHTGEFRIYDFDTKAIIGQLKLTNTISNPSSSQIPKLYIDKENKRVYISNIFNTTYIIDISNFKNPTLLGTHYDSGNKILGNIGKTIFYQHYDLNNNIIDFTNPSNPIAIDKLENIHQIVGNKAYILSYDSTSSLYETKKIPVMNIANPNNITLLHEYDSTIPSFINEYFVKENYLYIIQSSTLYIFHLDNLGGINFIGKYFDNYNDLRGHIVDVKDNLLYIETYQKLILINVEEKMQPVLEKIIKNNVSYTNYFSISNNYIINRNNIIDLKRFISQNHRALYNKIHTWGILEGILNNSLYLIENTGINIKEINIENPLKVYLKNSYRLQKDSFIGNSGSSSSANLNVIKNNKLYTMKDSNILEIYNLENLTQAVNTIKLNIDSNATISALWINNKDTLYISSDRYINNVYAKTKLQKFNISDLNNPKEFGSLFLSTPISNIAFQDNKLCITCGLDGMYLIDWLNYEPSILDTYQRNAVKYSGSAYFSKIILKDNLAYVTVEGKYIEIFNISNGDFNFISSYKDDNKLGYISEIIIEGNLLYYISSLGIYILDISDSYNVKNLKHYKYSIDSPFFMKKDNLIYSVDNWNHDGLYIIDLNLFDKSNL